MNLAEFLRHGGTDVAAVVQEVAAATGLGPQDVLLAVGSLVEGLATRKSDLDLLLITPEPEARLQGRGDITLIVGRCLVDVQIVPRATIDSLVYEFEAWTREPWSVTHAARFDLQQRILLNRLLRGRELAVEQPAIDSRLPRPGELDVARLKLQVARQDSRTIQVDMVGNREQRDYRSLVAAAQEVLGHAVDAILAGYRTTNPLRKWRSRFLDSVPADWERSVVLRPSGLSAADLVWQLHRAPKRPAPEACLEHALRITTFARAVFAWAELRILRQAPEEWAVPRWPAGPASPGEPLPHLDIDVDFLITEDGVAVARLNEFGEPLTLSLRDFALALLFDGSTSADAAELAVFGDGDGSPTGSRARALVARLSEAGLLVGSKQRDPARTKA